MAVIKRKFLVSFSPKEAITSSAEPTVVEPVFFSSRSLMFMTENCNNRWVIFMFLYCNLLFLLEVLSLMRYQHWKFKNW